MSFLHRFVDRIERTELLDRVAEKLATVSQPLATRPFVRDALTGRWLGHSVHPALVAVPIGCWTGALILDATAPGSAAARRLVGVGVLSALPAASTGAADWLDTAGAERRVGTAHALANDVAVTAFALSWFARRRGATWLGVGLSGIGLGAVAVAGHLGGHLAYRAGLASTPPRSSPDRRCGRPSSVPSISNSVSPHRSTWKAWSCLRCAGTTASTSWRTAAPTAGPRSATERSSTGASSARGTAVAST